MENQKLIKLNNHEAKQIYGGWKLLALALPFIIKSVLTSIVSFKAIMSNEGAIKTNDLEAKWDNSSRQTKASNTKTVYYAY